jgi:hypothetical protein
MRPHASLGHVKRLLPLLCWLLAAPALAGGGTTLFDDGEWRAVGVGAGTMAVIGNGAQGDFAALEFSYDLGAGFVPVLRLLDDGTIEPRLPPPGEPGATAVLGRYFECDGGLTGPLRFVSLELPEKAKGSGLLELTGTLSNFDSLVSDKLKIRLPRPKADRVRVELQYKLRATRDLCVDPERHDTQEEFRIVELRTRFLSPAAHQSDLTRYVKAIDLDCDLFGDCDFDRRSFCAALENVTGYVIDAPNKLRDREIGLFHTSNAPDPTPTLVIEMQKPHPGAVKPQGFVTQSADPNARNVAFWADWGDVKREHRNGKTVGSFRFTLEAEPPRNPSCDRRQN